MAKSEKLSAEDCRLIEFDTSYENSAAKYAKVRWDALSEIVREFQRVARGAIHPDLAAPAFKWDTWELDAVADISDCALPCHQIADMVYLHDLFCVFVGGGYVGRGRIEKASKGNAGGVSGI